MEIITEQQIDKCYQQVANLPANSYIIVDNKMAVTKDFMLGVLNKIKTQEREIKRLQGKA
jgi:hypothetical protein